MPYMQRADTHVECCDASGGWCSYQAENSDASAAADELGNGRGLSRLYNA
jgi:hypothetical protein